MEGKEAYGRIWVLNYNADDNSPKGSHRAMRGRSPFLSMQKKPKKQIIVLRNYFMILKLAYNQEFKQKRIDLFGSALLWWLLQ